MGLGDIGEVLGGIKDKFLEIISFDTTRVGELSPELGSAMSGLITILKAAGIIIIIYIVFLLIKSLLGMRRNMRIDATYHKVNQIDEKINILIEQNKEYRKLFEKKEAEGKFKKRGIIRRFIRRLEGKEGEKPAGPDLVPKQTKEVKELKEMKPVLKVDDTPLPEIKKPEKSEKRVSEKNESRKSIKKKKQKKK